MQSALDLQYQNISAPTLLDRCPEIPLPQNRILELVEQDAQITPRQKCHRLWHYVGVRPSFCQRTHILQVARAKALDSGELDLESQFERIGDIVRRAQQFNVEEHDSTSRLMQLSFVPSESTSSYFEALRSYLDAHGCAVAIYSDKHSAFRVNRPEAKGGAGVTQFGRALAELNIEIIGANSSQAKEARRTS